jgi:hypothetical protein
MFSFCLYSLSDDNSFFEILPDQEKEQAEQGRSCFCDIEGEAKQDEKCDDNANIFASIDASRIEVLTQFNDQSSQFDLRRSVDSHWYSDDIIDHEDRSFFVDDEDVKHAINRIRNKRSPTEVMSEDEATKYCKRQIEESTAGRTCKDISGTSVKNAMLQCVNDLKVLSKHSIQMHFYYIIGLHVTSATPCSMIFKGFLVSFLLSLCHAICLICFLHYIPLGMIINIVNFNVNIQIVVNFKLEP